MHLDIGSFMVGPEPTCGGSEWWLNPENPHTNCWEWQWSEDNTPYVPESGFSSGGDCAQHSFTVFVTCENADGLLTLSKQDTSVVFMIFLQAPLLHAKDLVP